MTRRWDIEEVEDDIASLIWDTITDDVARALDYHGWMIVRKSNDDRGKWPIDGDTGHVPEWAQDIAPKHEGGAR